MSIFGYVGLGIAVLAIIFVTFLLATSNSDLTTIDDPSGQKILTKNTGAITGDLVNYIGFEILTEKGIDPDTYGDIAKIIRSYFSYQYPHFNRVSYRAKDGVNIDGNKYKITAESNSGALFKIEINVESRNDYTIKISDKTAEIFTYKNSERSTITKNKETFASSNLPHTITLEDGTEATLSKRTYDDTLELSLNSCGDENLKNEADEAMKAWIVSKNYKIEDIQYDIPDYCDGEDEHIH
jgi:hypothetical protein